MLEENETETVLKDGTIRRERRRRFAPPDWRPDAWLLERRSPRYARPKVRRMTKGTGRRRRSRPTIEVVRYRVPPCQSPSRFRAMSIDPLIAFSRSRQRPPSHGTADMPSSPRIAIRLPVLASLYAAPSRGRTSGTTVPRPPMLKARPLRLVAAPYGAHQLDELPGSLGQHVEKRFPAAHGELL